MNKEARKGRVSAVKRVLMRVISVPKEEFELTEIISGQPLSDVAEILGILEPRVQNLSDPSLAGSEKYIGMRRMHLTEPLAQIAEPLGLEIVVKFYDINGIPIYFVDEPPVTELVKKIYIYLKSRIGEIGLSKSSDILSVFRDAFEDLGIDPNYALAEPEVKAAIYYTWRDLLGYGPLEIPMEDTNVEEVSWFAFDGPVEVVDKEVEKKYPNAEFIYTNIFIPRHLDDMKKKFFMTQVVRTITSRARAGLTTAKPIAEARIPDPSGRGFHRLAAHLDITSRSPGLTIRKFPPVKYSLTKLIYFNTLSSLEAAYLVYQLIKRGFILIVGGMASGKSDKEDDKPLVKINGKPLQMSFGELWEFLKGDSDIMYYRGYEILAPRQQVLVASIDTRNFRTLWAPGILIRHKYSGVMKVIKLTNGYEVTVTPDHSLLVKRNGRIIPVKPVDVRPGDKVPILPPYQFPGIDSYTIAPLAEIKEIKDVDYDGYVYDFEVPGPQNFLSNNVFLHNTTLLQAIISALPVSYKVITIEDTPELSTPAQNWHPLYVRRAPTQSELENVDFSRLVMHSLRHRGTVVTLGEVRGKEMADLIQAAASGHAAICLKPDAPVIVRISGRESIVSMEELFKLVKSGAEVEVLSYNARNNRYTWKKVTRAYRVRTNTWITVYTASGRIIEMTPDHRMPVLTEKGETAIKEAREIVIGDRLIIATHLPQARVIKTFIIVDNIYVELDKNLGELYGIILAEGRRYSRRITIPKNTKIISYLSRLSKKLGFKVRVGKSRITLSGVSIHRLLNRISEVIKDHPLSLPKQFIEGIYLQIDRRTLVVNNNKLALALHYALKTISVDTVVFEDRIRVLGRINGTIHADVVTKVEVQEVNDEPAYDIEVEDTHTFITSNSIISLNCTFHAHDPETVLARITSPPINAAPESLKLITAIVHVAHTKTFVKGRPEAVRRVMRIFEIKDVKGRNVISETIFRWDPTSDTHMPVLNPRNPVEALVEVWKKSRVVRMIGYNVYGDVEPQRVLVDIYVLARFLDKKVEKGTFDIKKLLFDLTAFYLEMDSISQKLWDSGFKKFFKQYGILE